MTALAAGVRYPFGMELSHAHEPALQHARPQPVLLRRDQTVAAALELIRSQVLPDRVVYFYVVDENERLVGVVPVRALLGASLEAEIGTLMAKPVLALPHSASVLQACEFMATHRLLAAPLVHADGTLAGVVDMTLLSSELDDFAERRSIQDAFETLGLRLALLREARPGRRFRLRFPWLLATITGGTVCALVAGLFEATLAASLILAFFLTLVLGLAESVGVQTMTVTVQALHTQAPTLGWYARALRREGATAMALGLACGGLVGAIVWTWQAAVLEAVVIGGSVAGTILAASLIGLSVPAAVHAARLDPKVSSGPITLALTDLFTITAYLGLATVLLGS